MEYNNSLGNNQFENREFVPEPETSHPVPPVRTQYNLAYLVSGISLVVAVASIIFVVSQQAKQDVQMSNIRAEQSASLTAMLLSQRARVAGAGTGEVFPERMDVFVSPDVPRLGSKEAKVEIVEFSDFQCPFCHKFFANILPTLKSEFIDTGKASFVYQNYAFLGEESTQAASASLCAAEQGKYWEYHDALFSSQKGENGGTFSDKNLQGLAVQLKLDGKAFNTCLGSGKHLKQVDDELGQGQGYGVTGTPAVFVNGYRIPGFRDYEIYKKAIEAALAK